MLACPSCKENYNSTEKIPKILPKCGHTICLKCLKKVLFSKKFAVCPKCQEPFSSILIDAEKLFHTNFALQEAVALLNNLCEKHHAPKSFICLTDSKNACINCIKDDHIGHPIKSLQEIQVQAENKIQEINQNSAIFNQSQQNAFSSIFDTSRSQINTMVQDSFDKLKIDDIRKKRALKWDIEAMFLMKQRLAETQKTQITSFKTEISSSCRTLENSVITQEYLEVLQKEIPSPVLVQKESNPDWNNKLEKNVKQVIGKVFSEENSILEKDYLHELCERSDSESSRLVLDFAQRRYFEMNLEDDQQTLIISPKNPRSNFKNILNAAKIKKVIFKQKNVKFSHGMINVLAKVWKSFNSDAEVKTAFDYKYFQDADLILCAKLPFWESQTLKKVELDFTKCAFDQLTSLVDFLQTILKKSPSFNFFGLVLDSTEIDNLTIQTLFSTVLPFLQNLEELSLSLNETIITDLQAFCSQSMKLKTLKLSLRSTKTLMLLPPELPFKDLQELHFDIGHTKIAASEIDNLLKSLSDLTKLEILKLNLAGIHIEECHIESLSRYFSESALNLKHVSLDLEKSDISKNSLKTLCSNLPKQISELVLSLKKTRTTDKVIRVLVKESLKKMLNLTLLHLSVAHTKTTDRALSPLCSFLGNNDKIKNSKIDFKVTPSSHPYRYPCGEHH